MMPANRLRSRTPMTALLAAIAMLAAFLPATASAQRMPNDIVTLYEDLRIAIELEDVESIMSRFAPMLRMTSSLGEGWLQDLAVSFRTKDDIAAEIRFDEFEDAGDRGLALVTWALSGKDAETEEPWSITVKRADLLVKFDGVWELLGSDAIDTDALETVVTGTQYDDPKTGLAFTAPAGWRLIPFGGGAKSAVVAYPPDYGAWAVWAVADLPVKMTSEQMASTTKDILTKLGPTLGVTGSDMTEGPTTLAGRDAYQVALTLDADRGDQLQISRTFCVVGSTVYIVAATGMPPASYQAHKPALDQAVASTRIVAPEVAELAPEAGRMEDGFYVNDVHGCKIKAPEGWETKISEGQWNLQITMSQPGGDSTITLGMIDLPVPDMTAEQAINGDENVSSQALEGYESIKRGDTAIGDVQAYESISKFALGEETRQRHRVYFVDEGRLFFLLADAVPVGEWEKLSPIFNETFQSIEMSEPEPIPEDAE